MSHTYVLCEVSRAAYDEIAAKLRAAGYDHAFDGECIDMHGIALVPEPMPTSVELLQQRAQFSKTENPG